MAQASAKVRPTRPIVYIECKYEVVRSIECCYLSGNLRYIVPVKRGDSAIAEPLVFLIAQKRFQTAHSFKQSESVHELHDTQWRFYVGLGGTGPNILPRTPKFFIFG